MNNIFSKIFPWFAPPINSGQGTSIAGSNAQAFTVVYDTTPGQVATKKDNDRLLSTEGYVKNAAAFSAIEIRSKAFSAAKWKAFTGEGKDRRELDPSHELAKLLNRPNQFQGQSAFFKEAMDYFSISGNCYTQAIRPGEFGDNRKPKELFNHNPEDITVKTSGLVFQPVEGYQLGENSVDIIPFSEMLHVKTFNPRDRFYGLSPLRVVDTCIDMNNEGHTWNMRLLQNFAKPSGLFIAKGSLTEQTREFLTKMFEKTAQGSINAGKFGILEGSEGSYVQTSLSPAEMDWMRGLQESAKEIFIALGVPPEMGGIDSSKTFSNFKEARRSMWEDTIFPLLELWRDELNHWLAAMFGDNITIDFDLSHVPALREDQNERFERMAKADWLTDDEKREETGFDVKEDGLSDKIWKTRGSTTAEEAAKERPAPGTTGNTGHEGEEDEEKAEEEHEHKFGPIGATTHYRKELEAKQVNQMRDAFVDPVTRMIQKRFRGELARLKAVIQANTNKDFLLLELEAKIDEDGPRWRRTIDNIHRGVSDKFANRTFQELKSNGVQYETKTDEIDIWQDLVRGYINNSAGDLIVGQISQTTKNSLRGHLVEAISAGESIDKIVKRIDTLYLEQIIPNRSRVIARTETIRASNLGTQSGAKATGLLLKKIWVTARDNRVRPTGPKMANHRAANGQEQPLEQPYNVTNKNGQSEQLMFPTDTSLGASAGNVIQCRCVEVYEEITG